MARDVHLENFVLKFSYRCRECKQYFFVIGKSGLMHERRHYCPLKSKCPYCKKEAVFNWLFLGGSVDVSTHTPKEVQKSRENMGVITPCIHWADTEHLKDKKRYAIQFEDGFLCAFCFADMILKKNYKGEECFECPNKTEDKCYITVSKNKTKGGE